MAVTSTQIDNYISSVRTAVADFGNALAKKQKLGRSDIVCEKQKLMLLSGYLDTVVDYFLQYPDDTDPDETNYILENL